MNCARKVLEFATANVQDSAETRLFQSPFQASVRWQVQILERTGGRKRTELRWGGRRSSRSRRRSCWLRHRGPPPFSPPCELLPCHCIGMNEGGEQRQNPRSLSTFSSASVSSVIPRLWLRWSCIEERANIYPLCFKIKAVTFTNYPAANKKTAFSTSFQKVFYFNIFFINMLINS